MEKVQIPIRLEGVRESVYAGFWVRFAANILDAIFLSPITFLFIYLASQGVLLYSIGYILGFVFSLWWGVYLVRHHGGSPGKLVMGLKIIRIDGMEVGWQAAILRSIVGLVFSLWDLLCVLFILVFLVDVAHFSELPFSAKQAYVQSFYPGLHEVITWISVIWAISELVVLLLNERKRALHDYIGGTVVIRKIYEPHIRQEMGLE
ncbi:MAG: RDD family protein [Bacteroidota bacterium]